MRLTTEQVARRLGVKPQTVYSYVSRGMLRSVRSSDGRGSLFDADDVERLAGQPSRLEKSPPVRTRISVVKDGRLFYRGHDATDLARDHTFEDVVGLLWTERLGADGALKFVAPADGLRLAQAAGAPLPAPTRLTDRLLVITAVAAAADPLRFNTQPEAVMAVSAGLLATLVHALPPLGGVPVGDTRLAARLWPRLTHEEASEAGLDALNAALVLLADHGLATSTFAARVAASSRAHPYAVVAAGLSAFDGPLHGAAVTQAHRLLAEAIRTGDPMGVYAERLRTEGRVEGFFEQSHPRYPGGDVRAVALIKFLETLPVPKKVQKAIDGLMDAATARSPRKPNVELALAMLVHACGMRSDAGEAIFALARTAGWIAHALEEYEEPGLRFRLEGSYVGEPTA